MNTFSLTRRTIYNQFVERIMRWKICLQFTDLSFQDQKLRCYVVSMASVSVPVTSRGTLFDQ